MIGVRGRRLGNIHRVRSREGLLEPLLKRRFEQALLGGFGVLWICFFFQAEDGIRDGRVTGVQTCALPILTMDLKAEGNLLYLLGVTGDELGGSLWAEVHGQAGGTVPRVDLERAPVLFRRLHERSEERRVGKECRSRWSPYHYKTEIADDHL